MDRRRLVTEEERSALTRVGVPMNGPISAPFLTNATSQYNTLRQRVTPESRETHRNGPGQVGLLVYVKAFPQAKDPNNPQQDEVRDAVAAELQKNDLIYLDHSDTAGSGQDVLPRKVYGNPEAQALTNELFDLVSYIRQIKVNTAMVCYESSRCLTI